MTAALGWGGLAASSLLLGALLGMTRQWPPRAVGALLAFGAGALISAVSFDLFEEGARLGGGLPVASGLAVGALTYFLANRQVERMERRKQHEMSAGGGSAAGAGAALALGAFLDGIPEQLVLGIGLAQGDGVSTGLLAAIFISNLPEATGSATDMRAAGHTPRSITMLWAAVAALCTLVSGVGFAVAEGVSGEFLAAVNGFAAGALLVMLVDTMIPEATRNVRDVAGLFTVLGFAVAAGLSALS